MGKSYLSDLTEIEGFKAASLVDANSGKSLASYGSGIDIDLASEGNTEVLNTKRRVVQLLELDDVIEDILIRACPHLSFSKKILMIKCDFNFLK